MLTIQAAIEAADTLFVTANVYVAAGTYSVDSGGASAIVMREGISLLGGYDPANWGIRDPAHRISKIVDIGSADLSTILSEAGVTNATVIDGFFIQGSKTETGKFKHGITVFNSSLTITNNTIDGGSSTVAGGSTNGIRVWTEVGVSGAGVTIITGNKITGGITMGTGATATRGIYNIFDGQIMASGNVIDGGISSSTSAGIWADGGTPITTVHGNIINGGTGTSNGSWGILIQAGTITAYNNLI